MVELTEAWDIVDIFFHSLRWYSPQKVASIRHGELFFCFCIFLHMCFWSVDFNMIRFSKGSWICSTDPQIFSIFEPPYCPVARWIPTGVFGWAFPLLGECGASPMFRGSIERKCMEFHFHFYCNKPYEGLIWWVFHGGNLHEAILGWPEKTFLLVDFWMVAVFRWNDRYGGNELLNWWWCGFWESQSMARIYQPTIQYTQAFRIKSTIMLWQWTTPHCIDVGSGD